MEINSKSQLYKLIYGKKCYKIFMSPIVRKLVTDDPSTIKINRELESSYITTNNANGIKSLIKSILVINFLLLFQFRYLLIVYLPKSSPLLPYLGDFLFPLGPTGNWIYLLFFISVGFSISNRIVLAIFSYYGKLEIYKDWQNESMTVYDQRTNPINDKMIKMEKYNTNLYNLTKFAGIYANFAFGSVATAMFIISYYQLVNADTLTIIIYFLWIIIWYPALVYSVNGTIY